MSYEEMVKTARGEAQFDLVLKNVKLVNVFTREVYVTNVGIHRNIISYVGDLQDFKSKDTFERERHVRDTRSDRFTPAH